MSFPIKAGIYFVLRWGQTTYKVRPEVEGGAIVEGGARVEGGAIVKSGPERKEADRWTVEARVEGGPE